MTVDIGIRLLDIIAVFADAVSQTTDVVVRVVAHLMPLGLDALEEFRVFPDIVTYHKEGRLHPEVLQDIKDERCRLRDGTVIEGQIDGLLMTVHPPIGLRVKPTEVDGGLFNNHSVNHL